MAKRKSINRRSSKYNRSSAGSGLLDPNSGVLGEEESFWWNNLTNDTKLSLEKYKTINETSRHLNSESQIDSSNVIQEWWKELDSLEHETSKNLPTVESNKQLVTASPVPENAKMIASDSDKESSLPSKRIRKIRIRGKLKRSNSNAFLEALNDSKDSKSSKSDHEIIVSNPTNVVSVSNETLKVPDRAENLMGKKDSTNVATSSDESHITDKILKSKPKAFKKRYKETRESVFEDVLKSVEDTPDETEKSKIVRTSSLDKSIDRNDSSDENIIDNSKRRASQFSINADMSLNDDNYIFHNRSDSSFEIRSDTENSPVQKNSFTKKHKSSSIKSPDSSKKVDNSANEKTLESSQVEIPKADSRNERSLRHVRRADVLNESKPSEKNTHSKINHSKRSINVTSQGNSNEEDLINEINHQNIQETSENEKDLSNYKRRRTNLEHINDNINIKDSFRSNDKINNSMHDITTDFADENLRDVNKANVSKNQTSKNIDYDNEILTENNSENMSKSEKEISFRSISTVNENSANYNENIQSTELDISTSTLEQRSDKSTDTVGNNNSQLRNPLRERILSLMQSSLQRNVKQKDQLPDKTASSINISQQKTIQDEPNLQRDQLPDETLRSINTSQRKKIDDNETLQEENELHNKTVNSVNCDKQKKINDYFAASTSKLVSPIKTKQSKTIGRLKRMKEDEFIKVRRELNANVMERNKEICKHLVEITTKTQLSENEIKEKIKKLQKTETKKKPARNNINKAYIVNGKLYKRPKLPRPQAWVTDRLYRRLWKSMEPKFKLSTRVKSEKFIKELSDTVATVIKSKKYADYESRLSDLMNQMAVLGIIRTRDDFYIFCHEFLPYDFRIKVIPMVIPGKVRNIPFHPEEINKPLIEE